MHVVRAAGAEVRDRDVRLEVGHQDVRDLCAAPGRTSGMDLSRSSGSYCPAVARAGRDERAWVRGAQRGSVPTWRRSSTSMASSSPGRVPRHPGCRARGGHRPGVVPRRDAEPRPLRPPPAVRAVAPPDRREPRDRRGAGTELRREIGADRARGPRGRARAARPELLARSHGLPPDQRAVIVLRHLLGYTPGEIARTLDLPRGTVNSRLRRGLDTMRGEL